MTERNENEMELNYKLIESEEQLEEFYKLNRKVRWMAFDTEFIPEKYYRSRLCLISVSSPRGNYIIDALKIKKMDGFLKLVEDPRILKITHAGENDYQILVADYHAKPRNIFDTQLSYGFLNRDYPLGLQYMLDKELKIRINKGEIKSDWEKRPLRDEQMRYAVSDVLHLYPLMKALKRRLKDTGKLAWANEENSRWEEDGFFAPGPIDLINSLSGMLGKHLTRQQKVFLIRLHQWRLVEAQRRNCPVNFVLKTQYINTIVRNMHAGKPVILKDRTIPNHMVENLWPLLLRMYEQRITALERKLLCQLPKEDSGDSDMAIAMEMLYHVIKLKSVERGISPYLTISRKDMSKMKTDQSFYPPELNRGWRKEMLGEDMLYWIKKKNPVDITFKNNICTLTMRNWEKPVPKSNFLLEFFKSIKKNVSRITGNVKLQPKELKTWDKKRIDIADTSSLVETK